MVQKLNMYIVGAYWEAVAHGSHCAVNSAAAEGWSGWMQTGTLRSVADELSALQVLVPDEVTTSDTIIMSS